MHEPGSRKLIGRPSPAMIVAVIALIVALGGTAVAASQLRLGKNSVGTRQLKKKSVTTGKIADNAINGRKVANGSLTGEDINLSALGTVPSAAAAGSAGNSNTVGGHAAACPSGTILIRGLCFDAKANGPVTTVLEAADACAAKGGFLPTPLQLYSVRGVLNLGTGTGDDNQFSDSYYANTNGGQYRTIVVNGTQLLESQTNQPEHYTCAYELVR